MLPILISVSVAPGSYRFCADAGRASARIAKADSIASRWRFIFLLPQDLAAMLDQLGFVRQTPCGTAPPAFRGDATAGGCARSGREREGRQHDARVVGVV